MSQTVLQNKREKYTLELSSGDIDIYIMRVPKGDGWKQLFGIGLSPSGAVRYMDQDEMYEVIRFIADYADK